MSSSFTSNEKEWEAESAARDLIEAEKVKLDPALKKRAMVKVKEVAEAAIKTIQAADNVTSGNSLKKGKSSSSSRPSVLKMLGIK